MTHQENTATPAQRARYARRVWAAKNLGAAVKPETALEPLPIHGPNFPPIGSVACLHKRNGNPCGYCAHCGYGS